MIYTDEFLTKKINKISELYDLSDPVDLFTMLPQEMELVEVRAMIHDFSSAEKKATVLAVIMGIADKNQIKVDKAWVEAFIDIITQASKGKFALNKEKK